MRVPFVVSWPGTLPRGKNYDAMVSSLDIAPTVFAATGVPVQAADRLDGVDLLPHLLERQAGAPHAALFWRFGRQFAVRQENWKLVCWKIDEGAQFTTALYDLKNDPGEKTDVAAEHAGIVRTLQMPGLPGIGTMCLHSVVTRSRCQKRAPHRGRSSDERNAQARSEHHRAGLVAGRLTLPAC